MEKLYKAIAVGVKNRELVEYNDDYLSTVVGIIEKNPNKDLYESLYLYNESHFKQFQKSHSLAGITDVKTDRIVFDFDSKQDVNVAKKDAIEVVSRLEKQFPKNSIKVYYSGNKGFHVEVQVSDFLNRKQFESITRSLSEGLSTFDHKVSDEQRIFRIPLSTHQTSKRTKIPLTIDQLKNKPVSDIEKIAAQGIKDEYGTMIDSWTVTDLPDQLKRVTLQEPTPVKEVLSITDSPDMTRRRKEISPAKYVLEEGFFEEGERNEACMILASTYRHLGYNKDMAYNMLKATLRLRAARLGRPDYDKSELWNTIIEPVYSPVWKGGTYSETEGLLKKTIERYKLTKSEEHINALRNLSSLRDIYTDFALNIEKNTIKLGVEELDSKIRITTSMLVSLLAAPGGGKTHVSLSFLNNVSKSGVKSIFFSLDMGVPLVYQRLIQKHTGHKTDAIIKNYENNVTHQIKKYDAILEQEYKNVKFCFKSGLTVEMIRDIIISEKDSTGELPKFVVIDYLECIRSQFSDPTASKAFIATALKDIANELGICIMLLVQPTKFLADPSIEINSQVAIKGSGVIIEASSVILGLYRPGFDPKYPEDDQYATIAALKNRMGELSATDMHWNGLTGHIRSLTEDERNSLKALREEISKQKAAEDSSGSLY